MPRSVQRTQRCQLSASSLSISSAASRFSRRFSEPYLSFTARDSTDAFHPTGMKIGEAPGVQPRAQPRARCSASRAGRIRSRIGQLVKNGDTYEGKARERPFTCLVSAWKTRRSAGESADFALGPARKRDLSHPAVFMARPRRTAT